jgi:hypothetical protein
MSTTFASRSLQLLRRHAWMVVLLSPFALIGAHVGYSALWWRGAEGAIAATVKAAAAGRAPDGIDAAVRGGGALNPAVDFREPYVLAGADNFPAGDGLLDWLGPGVLVAHARFRNGHTYHVEAQRIGWHWSVSLEPAEYAGG